MREGDRVQLWSSATNDGRRVECGTGVLMRRLGGDGLWRGRGDATGAVLRRFVDEGDVLKRKE